MSLFLAQQRELYHFLAAQVERPEDADDLLQETSVTLWEKFDQFEPGTSFTRARPWARMAAVSLIGRR